MKLLKDIFKSFKLYKNYIFCLMKVELNMRKRETFLGIFWKIILSLIVIIFMSMIFDKGFFKGSNYIVYLSANYFLWVFINDTLGDSPKLFESYNNILQNNNIMPLVYIYKNILMNFYIYSYSFIILICLLIYKSLININLIYSFLSIIIIFINIYLISIITSHLQGKFSDIDSINRLMLLIAFFFTPIIYSEDILPAKSQFILQLNPFYHFFKIYNTPLLNLEITKEYYTSWIVSISFTFICFLIANIFYKKFNNQISNLFK